MSLIDEVSHGRGYGGDPVGKGLVARTLVGAQAGTEETHAGGGDRRTLLRAEFCRGGGQLLDMRGQDPSHRRVAVQNRSVQTVRALQQGASSLRETVRVMLLKSVLSVWNGRVKSMILMSPGRTVFRTSP